MPAGLPPWYKTIDSNGDGQIALAEYTTTWSDESVREFAPFDLDGDGRQEMVAAAYKSGLWLLRPTAPGEPWAVESIDEDSAGFEHAAILADLDEDGVAALYVASDKHGEIRSYVWQDGALQREGSHRHTDGLSRFTWNLMPAPVDLFP